MNIHDWNISFAIRTSHWHHVCLSALSRDPEFVIQHIWRDDPGSDDPRVSARLFVCATISKSSARLRSIFYAGYERTTNNNNEGRVSEWESYEMGNNHSLVLAVLALCRPVGRVVFTMSGRCKDGPATCFQADPIVQAIFNKDQDYVGLVLVAGWPPQTEINAPYSTFIESVKECFDPVDLDGDRPAVYLYPPQFLHVTIATLLPIQTVQEGGSLFESSRQAWIELVSTTASQHPDWPTSPLQLEIDTAQIGTKAGILLWKETTGGLEAMRTCLASEAPTRGMKIESIPGIIHSSFLRFSQVPSTDGATVQERFQSKVLPRLKDIFSQPFLAKDAKLACGRTPYMHIPNDSEHVYLTLPFTK